MTHMTRKEQHSARRSLEHALVEVAERWQLSAVNVAGYRALDIIEGFAHEIAHVIDLGPDFEGSIREMSNAEANEHEAATLRIEVAALAMLGVRLSARRLWATANWRSARIPFAQLLTPMSRHERNCVKRFVAMVTYMLRKAPVIQ
jgi:hypothetical protein